MSDSEWRFLCWTVAIAIVVAIAIGVRGHQLLRQDERRCEAAGAVYIDGKCLRGVEEVGDE